MLINDAVFESRSQELEEGLYRSVAPCWWSGKEKQTGGASLEQPAMKHVKSRSLFLFFLNWFKARETSKC